MPRKKKIIPEDDLDDKNTREQMVEMAVEQFARLLWQRCLLDQWKIKNRRKYKTSEAALISRIAQTS